MKINLEVLTSVSIKRKKPWSKFAWIGQENEKLLLLDKNSASALSLTTGKTKKSIGKINSVLKTCVTTCISSDGKYLTGVVTSGNLFVWQKDNDALWTIEGLQNLTSVGGKGLPQKIKVFISQNVDVILVVTKLKHVFVWEKDTDSNLDPKKSWLYGVWSAVIVGSGIPLPDTGIKDAVVEATILNDRILGKTALCSFVFNNGNCICISSVHLLWLPGTQLEEDAKLHFKVHWHSVQYAFNNLGPLCQPLKSVRAYVPRYSRDSLLLALAINQKNAFSSRLLFVAPLTRAVLAVDLQGCGARSELSASKKCYQIADLGWTTNDALLAGVTHHGCFFLLSKLGDLLLISTNGCQMDLNYNHFPNLHPLIKVNRVRRKDLANDCNSDSLSSTSNTAEKGIAQRFSVTTHPTLPVILCSDGYLVTCLLLPSHAEKSIGLMEFLVMEANKITFTLHRQLGVFKENLPHLPKASTVATQTPKTKQLAPLFAEKEPLKCGEKQTRKKFEEQIIRDNLSPTTSDFDTASSGSSINIIDYWSNLKASNAGKIILGEMAEMAEVVSPSDKEMLQQTIQEQDVGKWQNVVSLLVSAWGFAVSNPVLWDDKWEVVTSHTVKSFVRLCGLFAAQRLDHSVELAKSNSTSTRPYHPPIDVPKALLFKCLDLLQFSILHQNLMPSAINLIDGVVCVMVHWCSTRPLRARGQLLLEVANVLSKVEAKIMTLYNWEVVSAGGCSHISEMWHPHMYCHSFHRFKLSGAKSECKEQRFLYLEGICKRLSKTWTRLYNVVVSYWRKVQKREVSDKEYEFSKMILIHIQEKLQKRDILHHRKRGKVKAGTFLCSRGCYDEAVHMWNKEKHSLLTGLDPSPYMQKKLGRCLHSILYTLLQNSEFSAALQFINTLLIGNLDDNGATTLASHIANQGSAVINTVLSMARFLTRYFTCTRLFIYPPYKPKVMPSVLDAVDGAKGCMLMSRESVQAVVVGEGLSSTWTPEAALSLLLLSGAFAEAAWFTFALGDWKMAFLLAVVCTELEKRPSSLNKRSNANKLPIGLQPAEIMATKLTTLLGLKKLPSIIVPEPSDDVKSPKLPSKFSKHTTRDNTYFFANRIQVLTDHMTASVLSGVDIVPSLVHGGVSQLERLIKELPLSVPSNYYLPAPPFYCLQDDCESICLASQHEIVSRAEISSTIQLILDIYKSSYTLLPIAFSYAKQLVNLQEGKDLNILKKCTNILDSFNQYQDCSVEIPVFPGESPDVAFIELQRFFRCLCCFVWMLHCRDEMEIKTRKLWKKLETTLPFSTNSKHGNLSLSALYWASRLTPFVSFMDWDWEFYQNVLTLVSESSSTVEVCNVFAACIPDIGVLPPQMDSRVQLLMKLWQTVSVKIDPPVAEVDIHKQHFKVMWLSEYHFIASKNYQDLSNNVQYRFKGLSDSEKDCNKTWPFETDPEFLEFITVFFDVIIHKSAEEHILKSQTPLLRVCVQDILEKELTLMAHDVLATVHKKKLLSFSGDTKLKRFESQKLPHNDIYITVNKKHSRKQKRLGMFQTNSAKPPTAGSKLLKCNSECVNICSTDHHQLASLSLQNVRRTRSMTSVEQKISVKERKSKPSCVIKKGNNCSSNCSPLLNLYSSSFADYFSILTHLANHIVENIDIDGALYKSSHLILWLYRWTNRASLQLQDKICDDPDFSKPQIRIQIPVDHILASMTLFKNKCASHETISTETKCKTSLKHVQDIVMDSPKYAQKPTVNVDLQPSTSKTNTNVSLKKSITEDFINSRYCEKSPKHVVTHLVKPEKPRSDVVDDYHRTQCKKLEDLQSLKGKNYVISSEAPKSVNTKPSYREVVKCKLTRSLDGDNQQMTEHTVHDDFDHKPNVPFYSKTTSCPNKKLTSEIEVKSPSVHHQELQSELQQTKEVQHYGQKDTVTITSGRNIGAVIQSLTPTANIFHESLLKISKMDQSEGFTAVNENSKQAAANVTTGKMLPHLTNIPQCKTNIKLSNSKRITHSSSSSKLVILTSAELLDSSVAECDNTLDDVTSPDSIQMSPPLESRENVELKSKKNTVRFVENLHPPTNSHAFQLLTVDASYLSRAWQDKVAQTMGKSHLQAGRPKQKLSKRVPHFLRLKAERDNDDSSSQGTDGNTISKANNEDYSGVTDDEKTVDSERLRGGGSRHKQPLPLFTAPPVPLASQSTPLQNPNRFPIQPMSPHRGYPLLHLPHNYQEKPQTIKQSELCHVCNQDNSCNDNIYVQGRLRQYWQDVQQASFCPATITDPFAPSHPASHPLVPIPLTVPCCPYIAPTWSNSAPYYRQDSSLAQYHLSPYSVILSRAPQTVHPRENISVEPHHRPRAQSETSFVPTSNTVTSQQNTCLNKFISLSTVSSASTQNENIVTEGIIGSKSNCDKSRTFHKVAASLSVSAPNITSNTPVYGPTSDIAVVDHPSAGLIETTQKLPSVVPKKTMQCITIKPDKILPKISVKVDSVQSTVSHGEVSTIQSPNLFCVSQTDRCKELLKLTPVTVASTKFVTQTEPVSIPDYHKEFLKEVSPRNPVTSTENKPSTTFVSGNTHQKCHPNAITLLNESTPNHLSPLPMDRAEFAESHFRAVHELEKAKRLLKELHQQKNAATKEVQTDADLAAARLDQSLKELEKTVREKCPMYDAMTIESSNNFRTDFQGQNINDCRLMVKTKKDLCRTPHKSRNCRSVQFSRKAEVCSVLSVEHHSSSDDSQEEPTLKTNNSVPKDVTSTVPFSCLSSDMTLYGRVAPGAKNLKHKPMKTIIKCTPMPANEIMSLQKVDYSERTGCQNAARRSPFPKDKFPEVPHSQQIHSENISHVQHDLIVLSSPASLTEVKRHTQLPGNCHDSGCYGRCVSQSLPRDTKLTQPLRQGTASSKGQFKVPKQTQESLPSQQLYLNDKANPFELCNGILAEIHRLGIPFEQLRNSQHLKTFDQLQQCQKYPVTVASDKNEVQIQAVSVDAKQNRALDGAAELSTITDSACELYGRRFKHNSQAQYSQKNDKYIPFSLQPKSEGEQEDSINAFNKNDRERKHSRNISVPYSQCSNNNTFSAPSSLPLKFLTTPQTSVVNTKYSRGYEGADIISCASHPDTLAGLTSTKYISSPVFSSFEKISDSVNSVSPSSSSWPQKHNKLGNIAQMQLKSTEAVKHTIPAHRETVFDKVNSLNQQPNNVVDARNTAMQRMSSNTIHQIYEDIVQQCSTRYNTDSTDHFRKSPLRFQTVVSGQGNVCNSSNRQTSGQDTADQTYTSHSELKNIAPTHTEELLDLSTKQLRPTFELNQTLISESNEFSQPHQPLDQESRHNDVPALLQQNVEESSPQPRNISSRTSDPPTDELPRKLAMGSVQRRLQSITNHINIMEKMSMELETDFQDTKKLLRTNGKDNVLGKNTDSLPSANCLSTMHDEPVVPFNCYLSRGNEFNLSSGKETQTTFNRARMKYSTCIGIGRSRSLSPPTSSSKSIPSYQGKNIFFKCWSPNPKEQKHHATAGSLETSPHRLIKCGSFQQLLVGTKADSIQDVVSSEMSTFSHQDRARARQVQKDTHFKLRMQEACQLMDEIVAAESGRNSSSVNSPVTSPALGRGSHNSTVKNIVSSPKKQTIPISDESSKCCCLEKRQNQTFLYDFDMNDDDDSIMSYLDTLQVCLHSGSENEDIEQSQESLGKVIADCAHTIKRVGPLSRRNGNENAHLKTNLNKRVKSSFDYSDGTSSVYTIPAAKFSVHNSSSNNSFGRTYSVGQHITVASTISEVSDETEPTSNCLKGNPTGQHCRLTSKMKTMKNKVPRKKLAVRMTKAVLLRKKLCKAKESQGTKSQPNARSSNCNQQRIKYLPPSSRTVKRGQMNQNPSHLNKIRSRSTVATNAKPSGPLSRTSRWREVPGNILSLSHRSAVEDIPDGDQTTEDFSYNGFEEEFFTDED